MDTLLKAEVAEREVRSIQYQLKAARFPHYRDLSTFDFGQSAVDEPLLRQLHGGHFMDARQNLVFVGGPGTGKTHLATALGVQAVQHQQRRVRFFSTIELVNTTQQPLMAKLRNRELRRRLYEASVNRGLGGEHDVRDIIVAIARTRAEKAALLGYDNYAALSIESGCAKTTDAVNALMGPLGRAAKAQAAKA